MLPDFVRVRKPINEAVTLALRELVNGRTLIAAFRSERFFEGDTWGGIGEDVDRRTHGFRRFETPSVIPTEELIERGPDALLARLPQLARDMAEQIERRMLEAIHEAAGRETAGKAIAASTGGTWEEFLAGMKKMTIDFDPAGNPIMPALVLTPAVAARLKEWEVDPKCVEDMQEVLRLKREDFNDREGNRTLVD